MVRKESDFQADNCDKINLFSNTSFWVLDLRRLLPVLLLVCIQIKNSLWTLPKLYSKRQMKVFKQEITHPNINIILILIKLKYWQG